VLMGMEPAHPAPAAAAATTTEQAQDLIDVRPPTPTPNPKKSPRPLHRRASFPHFRMRYRTLRWIIGSVNLPGR
jgi:hypothetical protein